MKPAFKPNRLCWMVAGIAACLAPGLAYAETPDAAGDKVPDRAATLDDSFETVSDADLSSQRGGFAVGGMDIRLGAEMRTFFNGDLVLSTVVNWDSGGATTTQMVSNSLTPAYRSALQSGFSTGNGMSLRLGDSPVYYANQGQTALVQSTTGAIQNVVVNVADNVNLVQQTDVSLDLAGYTGFRNDLVTSRVTESLSGALGAATLGAFGR